jgi:hypothetical protein
MDPWTTLQAFYSEPDLRLRETEMKETVRTNDQTARGRNQPNIGQVIAVANGRRRYDHSELAKQWSDASYDLAKFG